MRFLLSVTLLGALALSAMAQVNPVDRERGRVIQTRVDLRDLIREAYFQHDYQRVLDLCEELESVDPDNGISQHWRTRAHEAMASQPPTDTPTDPTQTATPGPHEGTAPPSNPPALIQQPPRAFPPPQQAPVADSPDPIAVESPTTSRASGTVTLPLVGEVPSSLAIVVSTLVGLIIVVLVIMSQLRRRLDTTSPAPSIGEEPSEWAPPSSRHDSITPVPVDDIDPGPLELAFAAAQTSFQPRESVASAVATLAAPWGSLDEAVDAIRSEMQGPPRRREKPVVVDTAPSPLSLDEVGGPSILDSLMPTPEPRQTPPPAPVNEVTEFPRTTENPSMEFMDADDMIFGATPSSAPPELSPSLPAPLDLSEDEDLLMNTGDLLGSSSLPTPPPEETTAPPLNLDDLLTPPVAPPSVPNTLSVDLDQPIETTAETPPPSDEPPKPFSPEALEETDPGLAGPIMTPWLPNDGNETLRLGDGNETLMLGDDELKSVLKEVPPPTENMSLESNPSADLPGDGSEPLESDEEEAFITNYRKGLEASQILDWEGAVRHLRRAQAIRPESAEVLRMLRIAEETLVKPDTDDRSSSSTHPGL